jgi:hypothetical protein
MTTGRATKARRAERNSDSRSRARMVASYRRAPIHGTTAERSGAGVFDDPARRILATG